MAGQNEPTLAALDSLAPKLLKLEPSIPWYKELRLFPVLVRSILMLMLFLWHGGVTGGEFILRFDLLDVSLKSVVVLVCG